jgi:murein DD-endopeptidase MepM/ murein hydrolase activator NlpD
MPPPPHPVTTRRQVLATTPRWVLGALLVGCAPLPDDAQGDGGASDTLDAATPLGISPGRCIPGLASAQFRSQLPPPATMLPGSRATVRVSFDNCSGAPWSAEEFALVPAPGVAPVWGVARVALPGDVPDGARVTLEFELEAPTTRGTHRYSWALARGAGETLAQPSPPGEVTVQDSADCTQPGPVARFRSQTAPPSFVGLGEPVRGAVTLANCGADTWTREAGFYLAPAHADGRSPWRTPRVELPRDVPFGAEVTLPIEAVAPDAPGRYDFTWVMQRGTERLGDASPAVRVTALPRADCTAAGPAARFVRQSAPDTLDPNQSADVDLTFANCGDDPWTSAWRINPSAPSRDGLWGAGNIAFPLDVGPGFQLTAPFRIRAPNDAGRYPYRWAVTRDGAELAAPSPPREITVRVIDTAGPCQARPVVGNVTSPYGYRVHPITGVWRLHTGIDFGAPSGRHIYACRGGTVVRANWYGGYGNAIVIDHGGGMQTLYAHQSGFAVGAGARVTAGQHIGFVGSTGNSTGPHLHFEVYIHGRTVDPARGYL